MLQFITILTISTALSVAAYKIQSSEMQENKKPLPGKKTFLAQSLSLID